VKAFLDTSVLVNAFQIEQIHHVASFDLLAQQQKGTGYTAAHCLAETYASLTRMPGKFRANPEQALVAVEEICERLTPVALEETEYVEALTNAAAAGIAGGAIYDAIIARCALKAKAQIIYTWNVKHFQRLGPEVAKRVREP
jgi:predicted nucleic acid-binding protein